MAAKTAGSIYENKQKTKKAMSDAALLHAEKMAKGDIEYSGKALETQKEIGKTNSFYWCFQALFFC